VLKKVPKILSVISNSYVAILWDQEYDVMGDYHCSESCSRYSLGTKCCGCYCSYSYPARFYHSHSCAEH